LKLADEQPESAIIVGLSGRGDKDVTQAQMLLGAAPEQARALFA
jgi:tryptophan synthase beta chain